MNISRWMGTVLAVVIAAGFWSPAAVEAMGFRSGYRGPMRLLVIPEVQKELRLTAEQTASLEAYNQELRARARQTWEELQRLTPPDLEKRFAALYAEQERRVATILEPKQLHRLRQLELQQDKIRAIARREVADTLKLSPEQRRQVEVALDGEREALRAAFQGFKMPGAMSGDHREEARRRFHEVTGATDARLTAILTEGQRKQLHCLQGEPFKFPERRFRVRRKD